MHFVPYPADEKPIGSHAWYGYLFFPSNWCFLTLLQLAEVGLRVLKMTSSTSPLNSEQKKKPKKWVSTLRVDSIWKDNANFQYLKLFYLQSLLVFVLISGHFYFRNTWNSLRFNWEEAGSYDADVAGTPRCLWPPLIPTRPGGTENRWVWLIRKQPHSSDKHRADTNHLSGHNCSQLLGWSLSPSFISEICPC